MAPRNGKASNRNSNKKKKEPQAANPNAKSNTPPAQAKKSPARNKGLPASKHNNNKSPKESSPPASVSDLSFTYVDNNSEINTLAPMKDYVDHEENYPDPQQRLNLSENMTSPGASGMVGDNKGNLISPDTLDSTPQSPSDLEQHRPTHDLLSKPEDPWHVTFNELRTMRARMGTLEKVEAATLDFAQQLQALTTRTSSNEAKISQNTDDITALKEEIYKLREKVESQQNTITNLQKVKDEFSQKSHKIVSEMNTLLEQQGQQVESLKVIRQDIKTDIKKQKGQLEAFKKSHEQSHEHFQQQIKIDTQTQNNQIEALKTSCHESQEHIQKQIEGVNAGMDHKSLTDQVFQNRNNIIITGLPEDNTHSTFSIVTGFLKNQLKLRKLRIYAAYRLGRVPSEGNTYIRPILIKFANLAERNMVWRMRHDIPRPEGQQTVRIQADIPKKLRDGIPILYRISTAASNMEEFQSLVIKDYAIQLEGRQYTVDQLENLPPPLRPSSLAVRESDEALIFFSKSCFLSNHFPVIFNLEGHTFYSMEHFLAFKRAKLSKKEEIIERALKARDPVEAKSILNFLREDNVKEWESIRQNVALMGLRAKFHQNLHLANSLRDTSGRRLGEASKNPCWGIGLTLEDPQALDTSKWNEAGNLLGRSLMQIRTEINGSINKR